MKHFDFVIVGAGSSGRTAVETLEAEAPGRSILLINSEESLPYKRTSISKNAVNGYQMDAFAIHPAAWYPEHGVELINGQAALRIDTEAHTLSLESETISYSKLLLATGARPCMPFADLPRGKWSALWTAADGLILHEKLSGLKKLAVVGIGVLGVEAAWQAVSAGVETVMLGLDTRPMMKSLDPMSAEPLEMAIRKAGVELLTRRKVLSITDIPDTGKISINTDSGNINTDYAVLAVGGEPEVSLARSSGIPSAKGILVDSSLKTAVPDIWAAGDCAEHAGGLVTGLWHSAENQGYVAALGMMGESVKFENPPFRLKCEVFGGYWFSGGPVNAPGGSGGLDPAETVEAEGITWRPRFRDGKLGALVAAAPRGMDKGTAKTAQQLLLREAGREKTLSVLKGKGL